MSSDAKVQKIACTCSGPSTFLVLCHIILFNLPNGPAGGSVGATGRSELEEAAEVEPGGSGE